MPFRPRRMTAERFLFDKGGFIRKGVEIDNMNRYANIFKSEPHLCDSCMNKRHCLKHFIAKLFKIACLFSSDCYELKE